MTADLVELGLLAQHAADSAAELLRHRPDELAVDTKSSPTDAVTAMDRAAEHLIVDMLGTARPDDGFLGEEGADSIGGSGVRWIIDPLDGTVNYLYRLPGWAVSVAAELDGVVVAGAVAVPTWGETFTAVRGGGAWCAGKRLAVSEVADPALALVATGFGYDAEHRRRQAAAVAELLPQVRDIRRFGAAAADLCLLASGRIDAYFERGLQPWDHAAGALIAQEAGAVVSIGDTVPAMVIAAPPVLFQAFQAHLVAAGA